MRAVAANGATPFLLVPRRFTATGTEDWWRLVASGRLAGAGGVHAGDGASTPLGNPFLISREIRVGFREWIARLTALGIPASRLGLMLGFQSGDPFGGRAGSAADGGLAADRQAAVPGGHRGRARARALDLVVVGVGDVRGARQRGCRQAGGCLHLPVGARPRALRRPRRSPSPASIPISRPDPWRSPAPLQCSYDGGSFSAAELAALDGRGRPERERADDAARAQPRAHADRRSARRR